MRTSFEQRRWEPHCAPHNRYEIPEYLEHFEWQINHIKRSGFRTSEFGVLETKHVSQTSAFECLISVIYYIQLRDVYLTVEEADKDKRFIYFRRSNHLPQTDLLLPEFMLDVFFLLSPSMFTDLVHTFDLHCSSY